MQAVDLALPQEMVDGISLFRVPFTPPLHFVVPASQEGCCTATQCQRSAMVIQAASAVHARPGQPFHMLLPFPLRTEGISGTFC